LAVVRVFMALVIGIGIGAAGLWFWQTRSDHPRLRSAGEPVEASANSAGNTIQEKLRSLDLNSDKIKEELNRTGRVIRENAQKAGQAISDATADTRITTAVKTKLLRDPELSAWDISVNTTDGVVTLSGSVTYPEQIGKAMLLAMETDGVRQAISTLQIKPPN
jgi:hyperosmotically inducible protein